MINKASENIPVSFLFWLSFQLKKLRRGEVDMQNVQLEVMESFVPPVKTKRQQFKEQALTRVGETRLNTYGSLMIVDEYNNSQDVWVRFPQSNIVKCTYQQFVNGSVKNVYDKSVFGIGFIGEGDYKPVVNGDPTIQYITWNAMLMRCYSKKFHEKQPTYKDCTIAEEWLNFQTFAKWYDENYYEVDGHRMHLDKDILVKGNKVYSPETCVFVPQFINTLFLKRQYHRGNLPIGVKVCTRNPKKFESQARNNTGKRNYLGVYDTPEEAFNAYKSYKEELIRQIAEEYKDCTPHTLYNALLNYKVEIND
jgi:hypothetical protein